jgi:hypothetical protein
MTKKIILISLFLLVAGALIAGGIRRTTAKTANEQHTAGAQLEGAGPGQRARDQDQSPAGQPATERAGQGLGSGGVAQGRNQKADIISGEGIALGQGRQGQGAQGQGLGTQETQEEGGRAAGGQGQGSQNWQAQSDSARAAAESAETVTVRGQISQAPAAGVDMILQTDEGEVLIGTGPGYLQEQGFELAVGDEVSVDGFWEEGEFKAKTITRTADGATIALRDPFGRPMWSGAGRRATGQAGQGNQHSASGAVAGI